MCPRWLNKILSGVHPEPPASRVYSPCLESFHDVPRRSRRHDCIPATSRIKQEANWLLYFLPLFVVIVRKEMQTVLVILTTDESLRAGAP